MPAKRALLGRMNSGALPALLFPVVFSAALCPAENPFEAFELLPAPHASPPAQSHPANLVLQGRAHRRDSWGCAALGRVEWNWAASGCAAGGAPKLRGRSRRARSRRGGTALFLYHVPRCLSKDFAEFAEENFNRRVFKHLHCTKIVQLRMNLRKFRPACPEELEGAKRSWSEAAIRPPVWAEIPRSLRGGDPAEDPQRSRRERSRGE